MKFVSLTVVILSMMAASCIRTPEGERAAKELQKIMQKNDAVGLAVAVVKEGKIVYVNSFGKKNIEEGTLLDTNDLFRIASISKSFTTSAIMQLVEKGLLSLDDDVSDLIGFTVRNPKFPETPVTLKMLLSHTSSLKDSIGYFNLDVVNPEKNHDNAGAWHDYEPGSAYDYCNLGFNMTGTLVEKYSGIRFDNYIRENLLNPLGLYGSFNVDSLDSKLFATIYERDSTGKFIPQPAAYKSRAAEIDSGYVMGYSTPLFSPTGGMKISARDLAKYMIMHMNYGTLDSVTVMSRESAMLMQTPVVDVDENNRYCMALKKTRNLIPGEEMTGHTGSAYGLYSAMFFEPEKRFGFVMITNGCNPVRKDGYTLIQRDVIRALYKIFVR
jgi:CubicO group peptidase (beta-lactamase class C family)